MKRFPYRPLAFALACALSPVAMAGGPGGAVPDMTGATGIDGQPAQLRLDVQTAMTGADADVDAPRRLRLGWLAGSGHLWHRSTLPLALGGAMTAFGRMPTTVSDLSVGHQNTHIRLATRPSLNTSASGQSVFAASMSHAQTSHVPVADMATDIIDVAPRAAGISTCTTSACSATDQPISIPLEIVKTTYGVQPNQYAYRLAVTVGVNGGQPVPLLLDTGSGPLEIDVGEGAKQGQWPSWFQPANGATVGDTHVFLFGDGTYGNEVAPTTVSSVQFYDPGTGAKLANFSESGIPVSATYAFLDSTQDHYVKHHDLGAFVETTANGVDLYVDNTFQNAIANGTPPEEGHFYGLFGANPSQPSLTGMMTKTGYIVEANGTGKAPGACGKACMIEGLTPELRAQFLSVIPWSGKSPGKFAFSGTDRAPASTRFDVTLSKGGSVLWTDKNIQASLDTGTEADFVYTSDPSYPFSGAIDAGVTYTLRGSADGAQSVSFVTAPPKGADRTHVVEGGIYSSKYSDQVLVGISFYFKNAVMYDLENHTLAYTPFFVTAAPVNSTLDVTPDMGMLGLAGKISGGGNLTVEDGGMANLSAANTYTGTTTVADGGWLGLAGPGSIADSSAVMVNGTLDVSRAGQASKVQALSGAGTVMLGASALNITGGTATFAGVVADGGLGGGEGGQLRVSGGHETLTGANTYTGATTIAANGWLGLAGTGSIATSSGAVLAGVLDVSGVSGATTIQTVSGKGSVHLGSATLSLANASGSFAGSIDGSQGGKFALAGGKLDFTGTSAAPVTLQVGKDTALVNSGRIGGSVIDAGLYTGQGRLDGSLHVSGSVTPGTGTQPALATMTVGGDYTQAAGGIYAASVDLAHPGQSSLIDVAGQATLDDGAVLNVKAQGGDLFRLGSHYTVLTAAGGISGTYKLTGDVTIGPVLGFHAAYDADAVYLDVVQSRPLQAVADSFNQSQVLGTIQTMSTSGGALFVGLANLPTKEAIDTAADQLSGGIYAGAQQAVILGSHHVRDAMELRASGRDADSQRVGMTAHGNAVWVQAIGGWAKHDSDGNGAALKSNVSGVLLGYDVSLSHDARIGVLLGRSHTSIKEDARAASASGDATTAGLYAGTRMGGFGLRGGAAFTRYSLDAQRSISLPNLKDTAQGEYKPRVSQLFAEAAYRWRFTHSMLEPFLRTAYVHLSTDALTERGQDEALSVRDSSHKTTLATLGLRGVTHVGTHRNVALRAMLGWRHASGYVNPYARMSFADSSVFDVASVPIESGAMMVGLGVGVRLSPAASLNFDYYGQLASGASDNSLHIGFSWYF